MERNKKINDIIYTYIHTYHICIIYTVCVYTCIYMCTCIYVCVIYIIF